MTGRRRGAVNGIGARIALAGVATAVLGVAVVALGVVVIGGDLFTALMLEHGESAATAHSMFDGSVSMVVILAVITAVVVALGLALLLGRRLARPIGRIAGAAQRLADGDLSVRVPQEGPDEVATLAESFNEMAVRLEGQEQLRREFIANAAHELRTPLTNLKGYLEGLRDGIIPADRATFESLWDEAERLVRLAASLDSLAEGDAASVGPRGGAGDSAGEHAAAVDVGVAIRSAVELAGPGLERAGLELAIELPEPSGPPERLVARIDADAIAQVLGNLLQNAERYTPRGGRVAVSAERHGSEILISITNSGVEIPPDDLPHVFERFYRVDKSRDRAHGGAGIGLAIVRQIVESAGGRVGVESGAGLTRFWLRLPT